MAVVGMVKIIIDLPGFDHHQDAACPKQKKACAPAKPVANSAHFNSRDSRLWSWPGFDWLCSQPPSIASTPGAALTVIRLPQVPTAGIVSVRKSQIFPPSGVWETATAKEQYGLRNVPFDSPLAPS